MNEITDLRTNPLDDLFSVETKATMDDQTRVDAYWSQVLGMPPEESVKWSGVMTDTFLGSELNPKTAADRAEQHYQNGKAMIERGMLSYKAMRGQATEQDYARRDFLKRSINPDLNYRNAGFWQKAVADTAEQIPLLLDTLKEGGKGAVVGGVLAGGATAAVTALIPTVGEEALIGPAFMTGAKWGGGIAAGLRVAQIESGSLYEELEELGIDPKLATQISMPVGLLNGIIEVGQTMTFLRTIPGVAALGKAGQSALRRAAKKTITKLVSEKTITNLAKNRLAQFGGYLAAETAQELAQETTTLVGEELAKHLNNELHGTDLDATTLRQIKDRYGEITAKSLRSFMMLGAPGHIVGGAMDLNKSRKAKKGGTDDGTGQAGQQGDGQGIPEGTDGQKPDAGQKVPQEGQGQTDPVSGGGSVVDTQGGITADKDGWLTLDYDDEVQAKEDADWITFEASNAGEAVEVDLKGTKLRVKGDNVVAMLESLNEASQTSGDAGGVVGGVVSEKLVEKVPAFLMEEAPTMKVRNQIRTAIQSHGVYQEALASQDGMYSADSLGPLSEGRYYIDSQFKGELELYAGKPGQEGSVAGIRGLFTFDKDQGTAWDMAALERGMDSGSVQDFIESVIEDYKVRRGSGGISKVALEAMVASDDPHAALIAMQWDMAHQGFTMAEMDSAVKELADEYRAGGFTVNEDELLIGVQDETEQSAAVPEGLEAERRTDQGRVQGDEGSAAPGGSADQSSQTAEVEEFADFFDFLEDETGLDFTGSEQFVAEIDRALKEGDTTAGTAALAKLLASTQGLDANTSLKITQHIEWASDEIAKREGKPLVDEHGQKQAYRIMGSSTPKLVSGVTQTALKLFKGHDADTLVEEWYHRAWDRLSARQQGVYSKYHKKSKDSRSINEHFAQEGRDFFFSEKMYAKAGTIQELFADARDTLIALIERIRQMKGAKIPSKIKKMYRNVAGSKRHSPAEGQSLGEVSVLTKPNKSIPDNSPYNKGETSHQLRKVKKQVLVNTGVAQDRVYEVSVDAKVARSFAGKMAGRRFKSVTEARQVNASPVRVRDWQKIYKQAERTTLWTKVLRPRATGGKLVGVEVIMLTKGCQRTLATVERVHNGILPNETTIEACYGGDCWVNKTLPVAFRKLENMEVRDLELVDPALFDEWLTPKRVKILNAAEFLREGYSGDSSHLFASDIALAWLKACREKGVTAKTIFISASYAPVTDKQYQALAEYKDLFEIHFSNSGWFHRNEIDIRLAEFKAAKKAGLSAQIRLITNKSNTHDVGMPNYPYIKTQLKRMKVAQNEVLETPFHNDGFPAKYRALHPERWRSKPSGDWKNICCETHACKTCLLKCMTSKKVKSSVSTSYQLRAEPNPDPPMSQQPGYTEGFKQAARVAYQLQPGDKPDDFKPRGFKQRLGDFVVQKIHGTKDAKQMASDLFDHPGAMEFAEFFKRYGVELVDPKSKWLAKWKIAGDGGTPRMIHKRLQAEYASIQSRMAGKPIADDIPIKDLKGDQIPEISALAISDEVMEQEKAQTAAQLYQKAMADPRLMHHIKSLINKAMSESKKKVVADLTAKYKGQQMRARARKQLREQVAKWTRQIMKPAGRAVAFEQRNTINAIRDRIDPHWRKKSTLAEREISRRWLENNPKAMVPSDLVKLLNKTAINEFTVAQIEQLAIEVERLRKQGLNKRRLQNVRTMTARTKVVVKLIDGLGDKKEAEDRPSISSTQERGMSDTARTLWLGSLRPARLFDWVDNSKKFMGAWCKTFVDQVNGATDAKLRKIDERMAKGLALLEKLGMTPEDMQRVRVIDNEEYTAQQLIGIYNFMQNPLSALAVRYGVFKKAANPDAIIDRAIYHVENEDPRLKEIADFIIDEFDSNWARLREATILMFDRDLGREKRYMPMVRTEADLTADERQIENEMNQRMGFRKGVADSGMTRDRVEIDPEFQKPIRLEAWDLWVSSVSAQEHLINVGVVTKELQLTLGNQDIQVALNDRFGKNSRIIKDMLQHYVDRVANPNVFKKINEVEKLLKTMRHNVAIAYLSYNMVTMLKQLPSALFYLPYCGIGRLVSGVAEFATDPKGVFEFVRSRDPQVAHMIIEREITEIGMAKGKNFQRIKNKVGAKGMAGIMLLDQVARCIGWKASYEKAIDQGLSESEATLYAQRATLLTQPAGGVKDLPDLYTRSEVLNLFLMFTNQLNQIWNMGTYDGPANWKNGQYAELGLMTFGVGLSGAIMWTVSNRRMPEDPEDVMDAIGETAMNSFPLFGRGIVAMNNGWTDPVQVPVLEAPMDVYQGATQLNIGKLLRGLSVVGGIPYTTPRRIQKMFKNQDMWELIGGPPKEKD